MSQVFENFKKSFMSAFSGFKDVLIFETNFKIMVAVAAGVVFLMLYFPTSRTEKVVLLTMCFSVLVLELINSIIERILDYLNLEFDPKIKIIKDLMASIVLLASLGAAVVGIIVLGPHIAGFLGWK